MLEILLTRHGLTERSAPEQYLGQKLDVPLSAAGRSAAERLRDRLRDVPIERVISSPLIRAMETARICRPGRQHRDGPAARGSRLRRLGGPHAARDQGTLAGAPRGVGGGPDATVAAEWRVGPAGGRPCRVVPALAGRMGARVRSGGGRDCAAAGPADADGAELRRVLVVSHSTLNRVLLARCLGSPLRDYRRRFRQDWTNLTVLRFVGHEGAELTLCNDIAHLRGTTGVTWG